MVEQSYSYYLRRLVVLGVPLMLQSLLFSSLGFIDNLMVSQLGTQEVVLVCFGSPVPVSGEWEQGWAYCWLSTGGLGMKKG